MAKTTGRPGQLGIDGAGKTLTRKGQGPGPKLQGGSNEMARGVPARVLTTRMVRRAPQLSGPIKPTKLVDYSKSLGAKS